jgi:hypothetical protein
VCVCGGGWRFVRAVTRAHTYPCTAIVATICTNTVTETVTYVTNWTRMDQIKTYIGHTSHLHIKHYSFCWIILANSFVIYRSCSNSRGCEIGRWLWIVSRCAVRRRYSWRIWRYCPCILLESHALCIKIKMKIKAQDALSSNHEVIIFFTSIISCCLPKDKV